MLKNLTIFELLHRKQCFATRKTLSKNSKKK
ncbi:hypothetical protein CUPA0003 [Campylobacter upsaliensis RM3195]|nr:hypothetical protein CUPA0003 [Campylobacter upsaliensis RM3195]